MALGPGFPRLPCPLHALIGGVWPRHSHMDLVMLEWDLAGADDSLRDLSVPGLAIGSRKP